MAIDLNPFTAPLRAFRDDPMGTLLRGVDNGQRSPVTCVKTRYALTLHAQVGNRRGVIGAVHDIAHSQSLIVDEEYEVDQLATGLPRELVPQIVANRTLTLQRYDLYTATIEQIFGTPELFTLADQTGPISLRMMWKDPNPSSVAAIVQAQSAVSVYEFTHCYITSLGRTARTDNAIVGTNATLVWGNIRRLQ